MEANSATYESIDEYIAMFSPEIQEILRTLRKVIKESAPEAGETINYQMPTFVLHGNLVHFAAHAHHVGFYPAPSGIENFKAELSAYKTTKGAVQFPLDRPLPYDVIGKIVRFRVAENLRRVEGKRKNNR